MYAELQQRAAETLRGAQTSTEQLCIAEAVARGRAWIAQYMDDNVLYAATVPGVRLAAEALVRAGNTCGSTYKTGRGKTEFQFSSSGST